MRVIERKPAWIDIALHGFAQATERVVIDIAVPLEPCGRRGRGPCAAIELDWPDDVAVSLVGFPELLIGVYWQAVPGPYFPAARQFRQVFLPAREIPQID